MNHVFLHWIISIIYKYDRKVNDIPFHTVKTAQNLAGPQSSLGTIVQVWKQTVANVWHRTNTKKPIMAWCWFYKTFWKFTFLKSNYINWSNSANPNKIHLFWVIPLNAFYKILSETMKPSTSEEWKHFHSFFVFHLEDKIYNCSHNIL